MPAAELIGRSAIVTGGSHGLGLAIAEALAADGARVVPADPAGAADWPAAIEAAEAGGRFDILVLDAIAAAPRPIAETSLAEFRAAYAPTLKGAFLGLQQAVAAMRRHGKGGAVALISSVAGKVGAPGHAGCAASHGGLRLMAKAAALELGPEQIRVNSVHAGFLRGGPSQPEIPLRRLGEPAEVAQAVLYLVSDRGRFVTGTELMVDGGWTAQ